jgi:hypothetical protein
MMYICSVNVSKNVNNIMQFVYSVLLIKVNVRSNPLT